jgi:putative ABC transport system permease protein
LVRDLDVNAVQTSVDQLATQLQTASPLSQGWYIRLAPRAVAFVDPHSRNALLFLLGAVGLVLLIVCANLANLLLIRATGRTREFAIRVALGACRSRLMRAVLVEGVLLFTAGGVMGAVVARWAIDAGLAIAPSSMYFLSPDRIDVDGRVLAATIGVTLATGGLVGLIPAIRATRSPRASWLRGWGHSAGSNSRVGSAIAIVEVAVALILLVGAGLMMRTLTNLNAIDPGFDPRGVVTASIALPSDRYPTEASRNAFFEQLAETLEGVPGVDGVAFGRNAISGAFGLTWAVQSEDGGPMSELVGMNDVSSNYFQTLRIPFLAGQTFDASGQDTVVISRSLANRLWPGQSVTGKRVRLGSESPWQTVVGVVADVENRLLQLGPVTDQRVSMFLYLPLVESAPAGPPKPPARRTFVSRVLMVRATEPSAVVPVIKARVFALDPSQPVEDIAFAEESYTNLFDRQRFVLQLMTLFSGVALFLAAAGVFAVLSQTVAQRMPEIAIRVALGAAPRNVLRMILSHGLRLATIGVGVGILGAMAISQVMTSLLFEVSAYDPVSYALVTALVMAVALCACWLPVRRATRIDPMVALRCE